MPLDIHVKKYQHIPDIGQERYATDPDATGSIGTGYFTNAQNNALAEHSKQSLMRYKDLDAYFCSACWYVYGVTCPKCYVKSDPPHMRPTVRKDDPLFEVRGGEDYDRKEGLIWVITVCRKCSFSFRVIVR